MTASEMNIEMNQHLSDTEATNTEQHTFFTKAVLFVSGLLQCIML